MANWTITLHPDFVAEFRALPDAVRRSLISSANIVAVRGPDTGRPIVDTLKGSSHANMKEMRIAAGGAWRFAFAFDDERGAVILVGGDKRSTSEKRFYAALITTADLRFDDWLKAKGQNR